MSMANNLLEIWGVYSNKILTEKAHTSKNAKFGTKPGPGPVKLNDKKAGEIERKNETGPAAADNFNGPAFNRNISDLRTMTDADKKEKPYVAKLNVSEEKFDRSLEKSTKTIINNNMKSTFNKLFEEVMNNEDDKDLAALGVDTEAHEGGEGGDEITITLSRELAQKLHDALMAQLGSDEEQHGGEEKDEASDEDEMNINPMAADEDEEDADEEDNEEDADEEDSEEEDEKKMNQIESVQDENLKKTEAERKRMNDKINSSFMGFW